MPAVTRKRKAGPRPPKFPKPTKEQCEWIKLRDEVGWLIDMYVFAQPDPPMREVVRALEDCLARGDHACGLLQPNGDKTHD